MWYYVWQRIAIRYNRCRNVVKRASWYFERICATNKFSECSAVWRSRLLSDIRILIYITKTPAPNKGRSMQKATLFMFYLLVIFLYFYTWLQNTIIKKYLAINMRAFKWKLCKIYWNISNICLLLWVLSTIYVYFLNNKRK